MMSFPKRLDQIPESGIRRLFELAKGYKDVISLGIGDTDFDTPQHIKDYAKEGLDKGYTHYTSNNGLKMLRDAVAEKLRRENGIEADPDKNIMITVGGNQAFLLAFSTFLKPGDEVLIPSPYFVTYWAIVKLLGGLPVEVPTTLENEFKLDPRWLSRLVTRKTSCVMINSPNNPTGAVMTRKDLESIADFAYEHDLTVVSDEVYEKLIYTGERQVSIASLGGMAGKTVTINSFSKTYAMTGWRIGYVVADEATISKMIKFQMFLAACPVSYGQYAVARAMGDPRSEPSVEAMRREYEARRDYVYRRLKAISGVEVVEPKGAFYIFPRIGGDDVAASERLLSEVKVVVAPGSSFGTYGKGHLRLCYATSMDNLAKAMDRMETFMSQGHQNVGAKMNMA
jgi:aminotransferase